MDSGSVGDRLKEVQIGENNNNVDYAMESVEEEVPKIFSPEIHDVFHIFVNMLDFKSFTKLAMTSKKMNKRCMENKAIRINVDVKCLAISKKNGSIEFDFAFDNIPRPLNDSYLASIRRSPCTANVRALVIRDALQLAMLSTVHSSLKEYKVNKINDLTIFHNTRAWDKIFTIIKDFHANSLIIECPVPHDMLSSFFQLNVEKLCYRSLVDVGYLVPVDSPIREMHFPGVHLISRDQLVLILSKIHRGTWPRVKVASTAVDWNTYTNKVSFDYEGPLPEERPLLFTRTVDFARHEYWLLHWNNAITKFICEPPSLEIFRCEEPWERPWILRKDEDVLKDLVERRPNVLCSSKQFETFRKGLTMVDASHQGPLPSRRPLCFKNSNRFWMLDEAENLMECRWSNGCATWKPFNVRDSGRIGHLALAKFMFWKLLNKLNASERFTLYCGEQEFADWFQDVEKFVFEYSYELPRDRPLVFVRSDLPGDLRIVLIDEERIFQCEFLDGRVAVEPCHYSNRPPVLITAKGVMEMFKDPNHQKAHTNVSFDVFRAGLKLFKKSVLQKNLLTTEMTKSEFWYCKGGAAWKAEWKEGRLSISRIALRDSPPDFMKRAFRYFTEMKNCKSSFALDLDQFRSCLKQFTLVPFEYSGSLKRDPPLAFVKNEFQHTCRKGTSRKPTCTCANFHILVWFFREDGMHLTKCTWGKYETGKVIFGSYSFDLVDLPPALRSLPSFNGSSAISPPVSKTT